MHLIEPFVRRLFSMWTRASNHPKPAASWALRALRRVAPALGDPLVELVFEGMSLHVPLSHDLPAIRARLPEYSSAIGRLAAHVCAADPDAVLIDVGANVGDTVAIVRRLTSMRIICIEASDRYFELLQRNIGHLSDVRLIQALVGADESRPTELKHARGSARPVEGQGRLRSMSLEHILRSDPVAAHVRVLKIDTDGMDGKILRGSPTWLRERLPVLAFEYDPTLWQHVGDDARSIFPFLMELGYASLLFYDNQGDYLASVAVIDSGTIDDLHYWVADEARRRYFDVIAFAHRDQPLFESFRAAERHRLRERHCAGPA